jgi:Tfp pilus assembly protein PilX
MDLHPLAPTAMMRASRLRRHRDRGVIMVIALITLAIMMIGAVALMRSMTASLTMAGNLGLKRDMANQAERAIRAAMSALNSSSADLTASQTALNYSAAMLPTSVEAIPTALLGSSPSTVGGLGVATNVIDLTVATAGSSTAASTAANMKLYYVVDRLCQSAGAMSSDTCLTASSITQGGKKVGGLTQEPKPVYRVTVRVDGPRDAQSFYQATFSN